MAGDAPNPALAAAFAQYGNAFDAYAKGADVANKQNLQRLQAQADAQNMMQSQYMFPGQVANQRVGALQSINTVDRPFINSMVEPIRLSTQPAMNNAQNYANQGMDQYLNLVQKRGQTADQLIIDKINQQLKDKEKESKDFLQSLKSGKSPQRAPQSVDNSISLPGPAQIGTGFQNEIATDENGRQYPVPNYGVQDRSQGLDFSNDPAQITAQKPVSLIQDQMPEQQVTQPPINMLAQRNPSSDIFNTPQFMQMVNDRVSQNPESGASIELAKSQINAETNASKIAAQLLASQINSRTQIGNTGQKEMSAYEKAMMLKALSEGGKFTEDQLKGLLEQLKPPKKSGNGKDADVEHDKVLLKEIDAEKNQFSASMGSLGVTQIGAFGSGENISSTFAKLRTPEARQEVMNAYPFLASKGVTDAKLSYAMLPNGKLSPVGGASSINAYADTVASRLDPSIQQKFKDSINAKGIKDPKMIDAIAAALTKGK